MTKTSGIELNERSLIAVYGDDSEPFLQRLISKDIELLLPNRAIFSGLFTPQGKYFCDFFAVKIQNKKSNFIVIDCEKKRFNEILDKLNIYRLHAKIDFEDVTKLYKVIALTKKEGNLTNDLKCKKYSQISPDPRFSEMGFRAYIPLEEYDYFLEQNVIKFETYAKYNSLRLSFGIPEGSSDIIVNKDFPLEFGFDELNAVTYTKGCFVGQELTARTHNRGNLKKRIFSVSINGQIPSFGSDIFFENKIIGTMRSANNQIGIAHLQLAEAKRAKKEKKELCVGNTLLKPESPIWAKY